MTAKLKVLQILESVPQIHNKLASCTKYAGLKSETTFFSFGSLNFKLDFFVAVQIIREMEKNSIIELKKTLLKLKIKHAVIHKLT